MFSGGIGAGFIPLYIRFLCFMVCLFWAQFTNSLFRTVTPDFMNDSAVHERIEFKAGLVTYYLGIEEG